MLELVDASEPNSPELVDTSRISSSSSEVSCSVPNAQVPPSPMNHDNATICYTSTPLKEAQVPLKEAQSPWKESQKDSPKDHPLPGTKLQRLKINSA